MKRRDLFKAAASLSAITTAKPQEAAVPFIDGDLSKWGVSIGDNDIGVLASNAPAAQGITPFDGERITAYRRDGDLGLLIAESEYRDGLFYAKDFATGEYSELMTPQPDWWNTGGLYVKRRALEPIS